MADKSAPASEAKARRRNAWERTSGGGEDGIGADSGFTLVEMLVVIAILALLASVTIPFTRKSPDGLRLEASARQLAGELRLARARAVARNRQTVVAIDVAGRTVTFSPERRVALPADISIALTVAAPERRGSSAGVRFFPDGGSSGADMVLGLAHRRAKIAIDWLSGAVDLDLSGAKP